MTRFFAPITRLWRWWGSDPSPRRRSVATLLLVAVLAGTSWFLQDQYQSLRAVVKTQEADRVQRRVTTAANNYALCQFGVNDTRRQVADMVGLAFNLSSQSRSESQQALVDAAVARVTAGLTLFDCSVYLAGLTPTQVAEVQSTTIPPTIPRRP